MGTGVESRRGAATPGGGGSTSPPAAQRLSRVHGSPRLRLAGAVQTYFEATPRPLYSLAAIFPLVLLFELGTLAGGNPPVMRSLVAQRIVADLFAWLGTSGTWPAGFLLIATLLGWHIRLSHSWRLKAWVLPVMFLESVVLTLPLFALHSILLQAGVDGAAQANLRERMLQTLGAAIYEELVFRLLLVGGAVWLLSGVRGGAAGPTQLLLIVVAGAVFSLCHFQPVGGEAFDATRFLHRTAAGSYLGWVFLRRGLALSVGCHALYNVTLLARWPGV